MTDKNGGIRRWSDGPNLDKYDCSQCGKQGFLVENPEDRTVSHCPYCGGKKRTTHTDKEI